MNTVEPSELYIVATPIGNLGDITLRALEVLRAVDAIYAEDTRVTRKLLDRYKIEKPLLSYREAATPVQVAKMQSELIARLEKGQSLAYVSDAGTPGISDPGSYLVAKVCQAGFKVVPIPGASALASILSVSGFTASHPLFVGFLPKKKGHQTLMNQLRELLEGGVCDALVFYESPERILKLLHELLEWKSHMRVCLGRELTKLHEEIIRGDLPELIAQLESKKTIKGEISLIITL